MLRLAGVVFIAVAPLQAGNSQKSALIGRVPLLAVPAVVAAPRNLRIPAAPPAANLPMTASPTAAPPQASGGGGGAAAAVPASAAKAEGAPVGARGVAAGPEGVAARLGETSEGLAPQLEAASSAGGSAAHAAAGAIEDALEGAPPAAFDAAAVEAPSEAAVLAPLSAFQRPQLPNPSALYPQARARALEVAAQWGVAAERLAFVEATASLPAGENQRLHFTFFALDQAGGRTGRPIYVTMERGSLTLGRHFEEHVQAYDHSVDAGRALFPELSGESSLQRSSQLPPDFALNDARRALPQLSGGVSFTLFHEAAPETGAVALWYRFYDEAGNVAAVNSRTGEARVEKRAVSPADHPRLSMRRENRQLGAAAAAAALGYHAVARWLVEATHAAAGSAALKIHGEVLLGGLLVSLGLLAWAFWGRDGSPEKARRAPLMLGAAGIIGAAAYLALTVLWGAAQGLAASSALGLLGRSDGVSVVYAKGHEAARKAAAAAKLSDLRFIEARRGRDGWAFDFSAGPQRALVLALASEGGGASAYVRGPSSLKPWQVSKDLSPESLSALVKVDAAHALEQASRRLGVPATALGLSFMALEPEGAGGNEIWFVADTEDGRRWAVNARAGHGKPLPAGPSRAAVAAAAKSAAAYKGMPWSQTEYSMSQAGIADGLRGQGATQAQMELFRRLCDEAPVRGNRFNEWSGD